MKIGIVVESFDPRRGGAEQWTWQFATRLAARGHELHVITKQLGPNPLPSSISLYPLPQGASRFEFAHAAEVLARQLHLDVIHDMGYGWHCDVFQPHGGVRRAAAEHTLQRLPKWMRVAKRTVNPWLSRYRELSRLAKRQFAFDERIFVAVSQMVAEHLKTFHGIADRQIRVVHNGVDTSRFHPEVRDHFREQTRQELILQRDELAIVIVAHNHRLKGVPALERAVARLQRQRLPARLFVVGGKRVPGRGSRRSRRRGITYLGNVQDPRPIYAAADVYAHPTFYDPCSLVVLEALACGLPVVTSRCNGASELMENGREGFVLENPADVDELTKRLESLFEEKVRRGMGWNALNLARQHDFERNVNQITEIYDDLSGSKRRAA